MFLLHWTRRKPALRGYAVLSVLLAAANLIAWSGTVSPSGLPNAPVWVPAALGPVIGLAYLADRWVVDRLTPHHPGGAPVPEWRCRRLRPELSRRARPGRDVVLRHTKYGSAALEGIVAGTGVLSFADLPFGRVGAVICRDLDFPATVQQAGAAGADLVVAPSFDWVEIDPFHTQYAVFRGIENGFSLVRQTGDGLSIVTDPYGRVVAAMDQFRYPAWAEEPYGKVYHQRLWWSAQREDGSYSFAAQGNYGQEIFVDPGTRTIIVRNGERYGIKWDQWLGLFMDYTARIRR